MRKNEINTYWHRRILDFQPRRATSFIALLRARPRARRHRIGQKQVSYGAFCFLS